MKGYAIIRYNTKEGITDYIRLICLSYVRALKRLEDILEEEKGTADVYKGIKEVETHYLKEYRINCGWYETTVKLIACEIEE